MRRLGAVTIAVGATAAAIVVGPASTTPPPAFVPYAPPHEYATPGPPRSRPPVKLDRVAAALPIDRELDQFSLELEGRGPAPEGR